MHKHLEKFSLLIFLNRIETYLDIVVDVAILVDFSDRFIFIVQPFAINDIFVLIASFLYYQDSISLEYTDFCSNMDLGLFFYFLYYNTTMCHFISA